MATEFLQYPPGWATQPRFTTWGSPSTSWMTFTQAVLPDGLRAHPTLPSPDPTHGPIAPIHRSQPFDTGRELGNEVVKALGMEDQSVKSVDLHMGVGDVLTANVVVFVRKDAADKLAEIFRKQVTLEAKVVGEKLVDE